VVEPEDEEQAWSMFKVGESARESITLAVKVNGKNLDMKLDTGAAVSIVMEEIQKNKFPGASH